MPANSVALNSQLIPVAYLSLKVSFLCVPSYFH